MARKVFISSNMSVDEKLIEVAEQGPIAALMWPWILTVFDDWGRTEANTKKLKAVVFPAISIISYEEIERALNLYETVGLIQLYEVDGKRYMAIPPQKWYKYQTHMNRKDRRAGKDKLASDFPEPPNSPHIPVGNCGDVRGEQNSPRIPIPSPSPSPTPLGNNNLLTCASPDDDARAGNGQSPAVNNPVDDVEAVKVTVQLDEQTTNGRAACQDPGGSVEAEMVTATPGEQRAKTQKQEELFARFWAAYPKKRSKGQAEKAWAKLQPDEQLVETMLAAIERAKKSEEWRKENGRYIPYPATWLNAKGWEDEYKLPGGELDGGSGADEYVASFYRAKYGKREKIDRSTITEDEEYQWFFNKGSG